MPDQKEKPKKGRPPGKKSASTKMLRVIITPRQEKMVALMRSDVGGTEAEHVRRALDLYIDLLVSRGELPDDRKPVLAK